MYVVDLFDTNISSHPFPCRPSLANSTAPAPPATAVPADTTPIPNMSPNLNNPLVPHDHAHHDHSHDMHDNMKSTDEILQDIKTTTTNKVRIE